jgi:hypothetical protein
MIDRQFSVWLIECNTNPCLEIGTGGLMARIIPEMLDDSLRLALDTVY